MKGAVHLEQAGSGHNAALRTGLTLAALTGRPLTCGGLLGDGPRQRRGLGPGGFTAAAAAAKICRGRLTAKVGQASLELSPGPLTPGEYAFDVARNQPSAAPLSLLLETVLLPLARAGGASRVLLAGGSHVLGGPTSDELRLVLIPWWRALGLPVRFGEITPGFFPAGGGEAEAAIDFAGPLRHLEAREPFAPQKVAVEILSCGLPGHLAEQAREGALERLALHKVTAQARIRRAQASAPGLALMVWAEGKKGPVGFSALSRPGGRPEAMALEACEALLGFLASGAALPAGLAARLLPALACAQGNSCLLVDEGRGALAATARALEAFWPGCVRLERPRRERPWELTVRGKSRMRGETGSE